MSSEHDFGCPVIGKIEDCFQDMHNKVHRRDIIIMDDDPVERLELSLILLLSDDLDFRRDLQFHLLIRTFQRFWIYQVQCKLPQFIEGFEFLSCQFDTG